MSWTIPSDTHAAGDTGHISDHDNMADVLTDLSNANRSLYYAPTGATAETFSRVIGSAASSAPTSGTLYCQAIGLHQNTTVNNITFASKSTALTGLTHGWYVLLDNTITVRAVSADQTAGAWMSVTNTPYTLAMAAPYTASYSGLYYVGIMATASGMPTWAAGPSAPFANLANLTPILCGTSSTGQTTPPAAGTAMTALTVAAGFNLYAYTS